MLAVHSFTCIFRLYSIFLFIYNFIQLVIIRCKAHRTPDKKRITRYKTYLLLIIMHGDSPRAHGKKK